MKSATDKPRIPFVPRYVGAIEGHAVNTIKSFYPQLCAFHEFDDLLQEAYIVFMKCKRSYGAKDGMNAKWFMSLFSNSLRNRMIGLLDARATRYNFIEDIEVDEPAGEDQTFFSIVLQELPTEVQALLATFAGKHERKARAAYRQLRKMFPDITAA